MKKKYSVQTLIIAHVALIFLTVYKHTLFVRESYTQQESEKKKNALLVKKEILIQQLHALKDHATIKKFALKNLKMKPYKLSQVKKLDGHG